MNKNIAIALLSLLIGVQTVNAQVPATGAAIKIGLLGSADALAITRHPRLPGDYRFMCLK